MNFMLECFICMLGALGAREITLWEVGIEHGS